MKNFFPVSTVVCLLSLAASFVCVVQNQETDVKQEPAEQKAASEAKSDEESITEVSIDEQFVAVDNMHHFMEYICEPSYKRLKSMLDEEGSLSPSRPTDRKAWKAFKNDSLVLAESIALVAARGPEDEEKSEQWKQISLEVHKHGTELYKSAGKYDVAKEHYGAMIDQCNKCHTVFAEGKYQLEK